MRLTPFLAFCLLVHVTVAQTKITGTVYDGTHSPLAGAIIEVSTINYGAVSDVNGKYIIELPADKCVDSIAVIARYLGFDTVKTIIHYFPPDIELDFTLNETSVLLEAVVIKHAALKVESSSLSMAVITSDEISSRGVTNKKGKKVKVNSYSMTEAEASNESYSDEPENKFQSAKEEPLATLAIDVDNASYSNVRRFINNGQTPPADAVRVEEMINYFTYEYPQPTDVHPFTVYTELSECPWDPSHKLLHVGIQGESIVTENLPPSNLVFLIDVSGSMDMPNKLPLVKASLRLLVNNLRENDRVAIVVYASTTGLVLKSTPGDKKEIILAAIDQLYAAGSTAGGAGIQLAYKTAEENFIKNGNNRVILCTDGDFNVGISSESDLQKLIEEKKENGVFLTCLGYGMGNYKDSRLEILADKGNGNYGYIDNIQEANRMLVTEFGGTLFTIAKDVKIQIEFNPSKVVAYRLIGYENRMMANEDFTNDTVDGGELGSGQTVTTLYEIIPAGVEDEFTKGIPKLKYQKNTLTEEASTNEIATVKFRYKKPDAKESLEFTSPITDNHVPLEQTTETFRFSAAVGLFGMLLQQSEFSGDGTYAMVIQLASGAKTVDAEGYKAEFVRLAQVVK